MLFLSVKISSVLASYVAKHFGSTYLNFSSYQNKTHIPFSPACPHGPRVNSGTCLCAALATRKFKMSLI